MIRKVRRLASFPAQWLVSGAFNAASNDIYSAKKFNFFYASITISVVLYSGNRLL